MSGLANADQALHAWRMLASLLALPQPCWEVGSLVHTLEAASSSVLPGAHSAHLALHGGTAKHGGRVEVYWVWWR